MFTDVSLYMQTSELQFVAAKINFTTSIWTRCNFCANITVHMGL